MASESGSMKGFAIKAFEYRRLSFEFENAVATRGFGAWETFFVDDYDDSIEFTDVGCGERLSEEVQKFLFDCGFVRCWLNYTDRSEAYYSWRGEYPGGFAPVEPTYRDKKGEAEDA